MNLAALVQSQTLATLLQALSPTTGLAAGATVEARLLSLDGDGTATAQIGDAKITLVLAGPEARQAALTPGATLLLKLDAPEQQGAPLRATLVDIRPAPASATTQPQLAPRTAATATPDGQPVPRAAQAPAGADTPSQAPSPRGSNPTTGTPLPLDISARPQIVAAAAATRQADAPQATQAGVPATASPRVAAGPLLGPALARQDGLAPLFANLRSLSEGAVALIVPKPLLQAADRVLAQAVPAERPLTPDALKEAVQRSGLFLEARQAAGQPATPQADLKAGLVALRDALEPLVTALSLRPTGKQATPDERSSDQQAALPRPTPPRRDGPLALQPIAEPTLAAGEKPLTVAQTLLEQTDAALDRITLSQYASLPLDAQGGDAAQPQRWLTEIPLAFHSGTAVLPLQVEKEPPRRDANGVQGPLWRVRFALDVEPIGPLQGVVTLQGRSVGVSLWAEREETSRLLRGATPGLEAALTDAHFEQGTIDIHTGQPRVAQATAGQFLDRMS